MKVLRFVTSFLFLFELCVASGFAQSAGITTVVGSVAGFSGDGGPATSALLGRPVGGVAIDAAGNLFIEDMGNNRIRKVTLDGIISTVAGNGMSGFSGDGGPATSARFRFESGPLVSGIAVDAAGNLFIADTSNYRIRKVTPAGIISTVAGNGTLGFSGDGGPATAAQLYGTQGVAVDAAGNLYIFDEGRARVRKVTPAGIISTIAGNGTRGFSGDGGPATAAQVNPSGLAVDAAGNLYIAGSARVRKVTPDGIISTVAGNRTPGFSGDGGPATSAQLNGPAALAVDAVGNLFIADLGNNVIRRVNISGIISTVAGNRTFGFSGDGGPAVSAQLSNPQGLALDAKGNLFIADSYTRVRKVTFAPPTLVTVSPNNATQGTTTKVTLSGSNFIPGATTINVSGPGLFVNLIGTQTGTSFSASFTLALDAAVGTRRITVSTPDGTSSSVDFTVKLDPSAPPAPPVTTITTYAGSVRPVRGTQAAAYAIGRPTSVTPDGPGGFYVATLTAVYRVAADGTLQLIAGNPYSFSTYTSGDGGPALEAEVHPQSIVRDNLGILYIGEGNHIRRVSLDGVISTVATNFNLLRSIAVDAAGNLYVSEENRIRKITRSGEITTIVGTGTPGYGGDDGPAITAQICARGITLDSTGNLYIADYCNNRIRKVSTSGVISTIAGTGNYGFAGDNGPATAANLQLPGAVAVDAAGNLYMAEANDCRIRKVTTDGVIRTIAGSGTCNGFDGDGGPATMAKLSYLYGSIAVDEAANLYIVDENNYRVRRVSGAGVITTAAGNGASLFSGDGGPASGAQFFHPSGLAIDMMGSLYIADTENYRVRKVTPGGIVSTVAGNGNSQGFSAGDGGQAISAALDRPAGVAVDKAGNLFIADPVGNRIRKVTPGGMISTLAGSGSAAADLYGPVAVVMDAGGNLFIAENNNRVRKITPAGIISTIAGNGTSGFSGDGGPATAAQLNGPAGLALDTAGNLYIADSFNGRIRKVTTDGIISTVAGGGTNGLAEGGPATFAQLDRPSAVAVDAAGNLFIADTGNHRIRKVTYYGIISTVAGTGMAGFSGDGGPPSIAGLNGPTAIALDAAGNLYIADTGNQRIRRVTFAQSVPFSLTGRAGVSMTSSGASFPSLSVGYARIQADIGGTTPSGLAIFGNRQNGIVVSEAGVPASPLLQNGRIYAEVNGLLNTGLAIANPNNEPAVLSFFFTNSNGGLGNGTTTIPANGQIAKFLNETPFNSPSALSGTFTFNSSVPIAVIALRGLVNERGEFLITTLPVVDLDKPTATGTVLFPQFADGGGSITQIVLVNPTDTILTGTVQFWTSSGAPSSITVNGQSGNSFTYSIPARGSQKLVTSGTPPTGVSGSVRVVPSANTVAPSGVVIFSFRKNGIIVSEAGVPATDAGTAFRLYAEIDGTVQTGLAVANTSAQAITITLDLIEMDGSSTGLQGSLTVPGNGQIAKFLNEIPGFVSLGGPFQGVVRVSSPALISVIGIRGRYNERNDFLMTTTPPVNEASVRSNAPLFFPQIADSGGYTTQFILFSSGSGESSSGTMQFFNQSGGALNLAFR